MKTWLVSDNHFGHANVIKYCNRPFASEAELAKGVIHPESVSKMNETMINAWNSTVSPEDTVHHLGDFSMAAHVVQSILPRLAGNIHLYLGNHDFPHPAHHKGRKPELREKWTAEYLKFGFKSVQLEGRLEVPGVANFRLFHLPYTDPLDTHQDGTPRHFKERLPDDGIPLLCGHVHEKWLFRKTPKGTPQLNIGVDAPGALWSGQFRPASLEEVVETFLRKMRNSQ